MKLERIRNALASGLMVVAFGCNATTEKITLYSAETGVVVREVKGKYRGFEVEKMISLQRVRLKKRLEKNVAGYVGIDYAKNEIGAKHDVLEGKVRGSFEGIGAGIGYFPFSKNLGFEFGAEFFHCDYDMIGSLGMLKQKTPDEIYGWGINAGIVGELPIDNRISLIGSGGYNFTDNFTKRANTNFDGAYGFFGVKINLNWK